jgi:cell division transport system permease protein
MRINNFAYLIKEGIRGIFLHGFMSFAAVCVTVACLLIVGSFSCLTHNVSLMVKDLNETNEILVYVDEDLSEAEARNIESQIRTMGNIRAANFVSREEALENFIADHEGENAFLGVEASDLRHRVVVTLEDNNLMEQTVEQIGRIEGVAKINAAYELAEGFATIENILSIASVVVIFVLIVVSLLIISNTVKMAMHDRENEIAIMKMVGATNGFIRLPYVVEGFTLGMLGAGIAFGLEWMLYDWMRVELAKADTLQMFSFVPFEQLLVPMVITFAAAGLFVGILGSWTSIRKFLDV